MDRDQVEFSLVENALDFILEASIRLSSVPTDPRGLKYAVLHLCAGIDLVLKERLRQEHWSLVFQDIGKANKQDYETGSFISVNSKECVVRLKGVCGISIGDGHTKAIDALRQKRNRLEHFGLIESAASIKGNAAETLKFVLAFAREELGELPKPSLELMNQIQQYSSEFEEYVAQVMEEISPLLAKCNLVLTCPRCSKETLTLEGERVKVFSVRTMSQRQKKERPITFRAFWGLLGTQSRRVLTGHSTIAPTVSAKLLSLCLEARKVVTVSYALLAQTS